MHRNNAFKQQGNDSVWGTMPLWAVCGSFGEVRRRKEGQDIGPDRVSQAPLILENGMYYMLCTTDPAWMA